MITQSQPDSFDVKKTESHGPKQRDTNRSLLSLKYSLSPGWKTQKNNTTGWHFPVCWGFRDVEWCWMFMVLTYSILVLELTRDTSIGSLPLIGILSGYQHEGDSPTYHLWGCLRLEIAISTSISQMPSVPRMISFVCQIALALPPL